MDTLDSMQTFVRVCELGSFAAASQHAGVARSVVTRQIAALERRLGVKLLVRTTRRVALTAAGTTYLERCRVILNLVDAAESDVADEQQTPRGSIRISVPLSFGVRRLAPMLLDFSGRYPEIALTMDFTDRRASLVEEGIDVSIRITQRLEPGDIARRIGAVRLRAVASPQYLALHGRPRHPSELINHECLGYTAGDGSSTWQFAVRGAVERFPVRCRLSANNGDVLAHAAALGMGITLQPDFIVDDAIEQGILAPVLDKFPAPELGIYAILPDNRYMPHRTRRLVDFLAEGLRQA
jgi:DNA-binding transcriptional LysR family regulator